MIKFFRKIRYNLMSENRTGKYVKYALGEILLVMIGILLALQVNNWNENRINAMRENLILKEINTEFKFNKEELESTIRVFSSIKDGCNYLRNLFPINPSEIDKDSVSMALSRTLNLSSADLSTGSISALINTSSFEIISNSELRSLLIQWEDLISDYYERELQAINYTKNTMVPFLAKRVPQPYRDGIKDNRVDLSFLSSIEFENLIIDRFYYVRSLLNIVEDEDTDIRKAIDRIIFLTNSDTIE